MNQKEFLEGLETKIGIARDAIEALDGFVTLNQPKEISKVVLPTVVVPPHDDLVTFIGTKIVNAKPMTRAVYNQTRGWDLPADEDGNDAGYLVEYTDAKRPNVTGFQGYISWSPKDVFEAAYSEYKTTAKQDDQAGEILGDGVQFKKPDEPTPIPFA